MIGSVMSYPARYWHRLDDGRIQCDLCPRHCRLHEGQRAFCFVRERQGDGLVLSTYGRNSGLAVDPIEKKPLNHFLPGSSVLSFGTAGCNLGCRFCQNWSLSKSREVSRTSTEAGPEAVADTALRRGCRSVAFTYNDPVIWVEYAIDTARACHERGLRAVAVTAGYITKEARADFFGVMDAANVDLKAFTDGFYRKLCFAELGPVLDTLVWLRNETDVWIEVTTLLIPGRNDGDDEIHRLSEWFIRNLGPDVPLHFSAFHPDFKMTETPSTPLRTLTLAREIARSHGLRYVYTGNVHDRKGDATLCPGCGAVVIQRDWFALLAMHLAGGACEACGHAVPGVFGD
jgi:pyruvate formate lyase activating enzyme